MSHAAPRSTPPPTRAARHGKPHDVVVIGSGFGGLFATKALADAPVRVTVIDGTATHLFQPLLYQVATGVLSVGEISPATRDVLRRQRNARVLLGVVTEIDLARREVVSRSPLGERRTPYDSLVVAAGAGQSYFGNDRFADFAPGLKSIDDALEIRGRVFGSFELAELSTDDAERDRLTTFVVVGAGPTGVEMAGQLAELAHRSLREDFRHLDPSRARIVLVDPVPAVLPGYPEKLQAAAARTLEDLGVELLMGHKVVDLDDTGVVVEDGDGRRTRIEAQTKVWAAGVAASPLGRSLGEQSGAEVDRAGRVVVEPNGSLPGHPEVFVVGDMAARQGVPGVAPAAMQTGRYAAEEIVRQVRGEPSAGPFVYRDKGSLATVSRFQAVAKIGPVQQSGFVAWLLWLGVHLVYLVGFKNRITTLLHWAVSFVGRGRSERTATWQQVVGRGALRSRGQDRPTRPTRSVLDD
ncbi:NAD(P)/FAD-dependent oxidoreductase [Cellulomonas triticagri]|uniref:NADH:ubiquinone reductase (non-electrogenic) n=1 Tax=Cellulomonas triticagri TaxID=2483352 RepID=A0A3M2J5X4_9CELL|nr:NAD(P)/FAD-dependent oxidoreductase [Cellulomonas triticagri]RMI09502.1 NAD(P)/FAD-dependent oxidoreductase [Cellulomonas triticagri]